MRLIDADELTNQLENKKVSITYEIPIEEVLGEDIDLDDFEELVKDAIKSYRKMILDTIKTMPAIEQRPKGGWIPITTRPLEDDERECYGEDITCEYTCKIPDDGQEVIVTDYLGHVGTDIFCNEGSDGAYFESLCDAGEVLAWMPLPEPYEEATDEKDNIN